MLAPAIPPALEIAPGQRLARSRCFPLPPLPDQMRYMLCEIVPLGGGTFRLKPCPLFDWVGMGSDSLARIGLALSESTLRRLGRAGFIQVRPISPYRYEFNLPSWIAHSRAVEADPEEFWTRADARGRTNLQKYREGL